MEQLSGVMIIIIIGGGVLTFVMLFIFAKRQIMRFTLRSRRGPHVPIGNDAKKTLRREIERRLDCIQKITQEPRLLWNDDKYILRTDQPIPPYYYRMKAVDDVKILETEIMRSDGSMRHPYDSLRAFLLTTLAATTLNGSGQQRMIHQFCDMYEHARHDPNEFGSEEYESYHRLLLKLIEAAKQLKSLISSRKTSPARTPKKQTKMHSLLDPARLRPPATTPKLPTNAGLPVGQQSKVNLTLGLQGRDMDAVDIAPNPLHLQPAAERDIIIRNRIKTPTLDDEEDEEIDNLGGSESRARDSVRIEDIDGEDNEVMSISSVQFQSNSNVV
ncbi:protein C1orf43 homolog [Anastrepha ludens]|uniref:protein C1orf43 homolog n=1 Tax=Anastrepha ludens TaxID=28586 RepID=UPI0023AF7224|nr:protein C1orf43 homolog [Anastrepha ludens]